MFEVVNTISGSIPATGYTIDSLGANKSDLKSIPSASRNVNAVMDNSSQNLTKSNVLPVDTTQQQKEQHRKSVFQKCDFKQGKVMCHSPQPLERNSKGYLWIITPVAASISVAIVIAALAGPHWLFTEEKLPNTLYNGTANFNALDDGAFITRHTKSSLWIICTTLQGVETYSCIKIDHFSKKGYQPDPHDSASAIPYTVTKSCPFFIASGIALLLSFVVFLIPTCSHQNNLYYFSASIMFIVSGLLMLIGLIAYISILKAEVGSKLRPRSALQAPLFKVTYGQSFILFVFGFITTEFVGLLNLSLYISLQEVDYYSRLRCFKISNLQGKIKEGENGFNSYAYKSFKHEIKCKNPLERLRRQKNKKQQISVLELSINAKKLHKNMAQGNRKTGRIAPKTTGTGIDAVSDANVCKRHANSSSSTMFVNERNKRYYFEKPATLSNGRNCLLHSRNFAKSLNQLYTEVSSSPAFLPTPPSPLAMRASGLRLQRHTLPTPPQQFLDSPQKFPLTRSLSTTTDIYATQNTNFSGMPAMKTNCCSSTNHHNRRYNCTTNTRYNNELESSISAAGEDIRFKTKAHLNQCKNIISSKNDLPKQLHREAQRHSNFYRPTVIGQTNKENHVTDEEDEDDDDDANKEKPQTFCGIKRSKSKGEYAGVRPKQNKIIVKCHENKDGTASAAHNLGIEEPIEPKPQMLNKIHMLNLHQLYNRTPDNSLKQLQQKHHAEHREGFKNGCVFGSLLDVVDIDENVNENVDKKLIDDEEHLYLFDDDIQIVPPQAIRSGRSVPIYVEPKRVRCLNSKLPLHAIHTGPSAGTGPQNSLYDLHTSDNEISFHTIQKHQPKKSHYIYYRNTYSGSQQELHNENQNGSTYQSRTLPRTLLKHNTDLEDSITRARLSASSTQLNNLYGASEQELATMMMQLEPQQSVHNTHFTPQQLLQHPIYIQPYQLQQHQLQQEYSAIAALKQPSVVQWPVAIPSSPSNFASGFLSYNAETNNATQSSSKNQTLPTGRNTNSSAIIIGSTPNVSQGLAKFQRAYAFDEQRRPSAVLTDAFDLDTVNHERRCSHTTFFPINSNSIGMGCSRGVDGDFGGARDGLAINYNITNGTAV